MSGGQRAARPGGAPSNARVWCVRRVAPNVDNCMGGRSEVETEHSTDAQLLESVCSLNVMPISAVLRLFMF